MRHYMLAALGFPLPFPHHRLPYAFHRDLDLVLFYQFLLRRHRPIEHRVSGTPRIAASNRSDAMPSDARMRYSLRVADLLLLLWASH